MPGTTSKTVATLAGGPIGYKIAASQAHRQADWWVQTVQNPYDAAFKKLIDDTETARNSGTWTRQDWEKANSAYEKLVSDTQDQASIFEAQGGNQKKVIDQWRKDADPFAEQWRDWFKRIAPPDPANTPEGPPTIDSVTPGGAKNAMALAAEEQRKRAIAGNGRRGTILGGQLNQRGLGLQGPSILGY